MVVYVPTLNGKIYTDSVKSPRGVCSLLADVSLKKRLNLGCHRTSGPCKVVDGRKRRGIVPREIRHYQFSCLVCSLRSNGK